MNKPTLVIMAAGIGSRYGGLKQIDAFGPGGELIIDYSIYDAIKSGFGKVVFIISRDIEAPFKEMLGNRISKQIPVEYTYQNLKELPSGFTTPDERIKPWGTAQAIYCCRNLINEPFAAINADDFYGGEAFRKIYDFLTEARSNDKYHCCMIGYQIENTMTEKGHVARGVCQVSDDGYLTGITERTHVEYRDGGIAYTEDGVHFESIAPGTTVSMNMWGFPSGITEELEPLFAKFLSRTDIDILKSEFYLPSAINELLMLKKADVKILTTSAKWYGVTYKEDKTPVKNAISKMIQDGIYPERLWKDEA